MTFSQEKPVIYTEVHDGVGSIVLNRAHKRNALTLEMWQLLGQAIQEFQDNSEVGVVLLRGTDNIAFSAGADIGEFHTVRKDSTSNRQYSAAIKTVVTGLRNIPKPTIAMISGYCVGGGTEISVACDLRFASTTSKFGITPAKLGFVYDAVETKMLADLVGPSRAKDILFSGRLIEAGEAHRIGLVDRLFAVEELEDETMNYIQTLLKNAPNSMRGAKLIINGITAGQGAEDPLFKQIVSESMDSPEYAEGIRAFQEKRPPVFRHVSGAH